MKLTKRTEDTIFHHAFHAALAERRGDDKTYRKHSERLLAVIEKLSNGDKLRAVRIAERAIKEAMRRT